MKCSVYCAMSLDGYIATSNGGIDWLMEYSGPTEEDEFSFMNFLNSVDVLIMGRNTFEKVHSFDEWPYGNTRVIVLTRTMNSIENPKSDTIELYNGSIDTLIKSLEKQGCERLYIDGGQTVQSFLIDNYITDITLTIVPTLLGAGISLFGKLEDRLKWSLVGNKRYESGLVTLQYEIIRE